MHCRQSEFSSIELIRLGLGVVIRFNFMFCGCQFSDKAS